MIWTHTEEVRFPAVTATSATKMEYQKENESKC
jgi:hypothetical protein